MAIAKKKTATRRTSKGTIGSNKRPLSRNEAGLKHGFRSGLEETTADWLVRHGIDFGFENRVIHYEKPARTSKYTPDFNLPNGLIIETKGRFVTADRQKHLLVKKQHPHLDIRFVFSNSNARISKQSKTTYADWCNKHGFQYADKVIPVAWINWKEIA